MSIHEQIIDDGSMRKYRTEIPNTIIRGQKGRALSLNAKWLYVYLKSVAGDGRECWQSTTTIAEGCGMSRMSVSRGRKELATHGLITLTPGDRTNRDAFTIRIVDIWPDNMQEFSSQSTTQIHQCTTQVHQQIIDFPTKDNPGVSNGYTSVPDRYSGVPVVVTKKIPIRRSLEESKKENKGVSGIRGVWGEKGGGPAQQATAKIPFPEDFLITPAMRAWFAEKIDPSLVDIDEATERWKNSMQSNGKQYCDWEATWRNGMLNAEKWAKSDVVTEKPINKYPLKVVH